MTGGHSIVLTRKAEANKMCIRKCKSIIRLDASQIYPHSMCQDMPTGVYTRGD